MKSIHESQKFNIKCRVKIKPNANIYVGEIGMAYMVTENLSFFVELKREVGHVTMWFDYNELEILK